MTITADTGRPKYAAYIPNRVEAATDKIVALFSPQRALARIQAREGMHQFRYRSAQSNDNRRNASPTSVSGDTMIGNRERMQIMWNCIELIENSGLAWSIVAKIANYVCGTVRYQAQTGDPGQNDEQEAYISETLGKTVDITGQKTFRKMCLTGLRSQIIKGDFGLNFVREGSMLKLQGIEADRIGNPYEYLVSNNYVGGIEIDNYQRHLAYNIFRRNRQSGNYEFDVRIPSVTDDFGLPNFLFSASPIYFDDVRGRSAFRQCLDKVDYIRKLAEYEQDAALWASSQSGVFYTMNGRLPEDLGFDNQTVETDQYGNKVARFGVRPNTVQAMGVGEKVDMWPNNRPSPNVMAMYRAMIHDIAQALELSYGFVYDMSGISGPGVRFHSAQDKRTIQQWQHALREDVLSPVIEMQLFNGIANGDLKFHPNFLKHSFIFPPHPTIDAGRETTANLAEYNAGTMTGAQICAESGHSIDENQKACVEEIGNMLSHAQKLAKQYGVDLDYIMGMLLPDRMNNKGIAAAIMGEQQQKAAEAAAQQQQEEHATTGGKQLP